MYITHPPSRWVESFVFWNDLSAQTNSNSLVCLMLISNKGSLIFAFFHCFNVEWSVLNKASSPAHHACLLSVLTAMGNVFIWSPITMEIQQWRNDAAVWGMLKYYYKTYKTYETWVQWEEQLDSLLVHYFRLNIEYLLIVGESKRHSNSSGVSLSAAACITLCRGQLYLLLHFE